ncbi:MAG TPA: FMN-binding protein [Pseudonocardia sp.]|nr:FMN-binding protein [Pseudonocardia sp.]
MKRIASWLLGTVTAVMLLFGYHTSTSGPTTAGETLVAAPTAPQDPGSSGSTTSGSTSASSGTASTVTGSVASTRWGPVQVSITVADGKITAVDVPQYPTGNGKDRQINASALPILTKETISAQSADIDMVSGATVTSEGYLQSLQSALDQAGL